MKHHQPVLTGLYAIADCALLSPGRLVPAVEEAIAGGVAAIQYRDKGPHRPRREAEVRELVTLCQAHGVPLIVNDDVVLARTAGAAGVHLGRDDPSIETARRTLGDGAIIGVSCYNSLATAIAARARGADYVAFGAFFDSPTKPHAVRAGTALLHRAKVQLDCTVAAIGGITPENGAALVAAGADVLAVIHGIFGQADPAAAARRYTQLFHTAGQ